MDIRGPYIRPHRGMRLPFPPMRGRPMMMMDPHVRHLPPRPHMIMRGGLPPFLGRPMMPPRGPRGPPVLLPHRVPLPVGPMGPLRPRGMLAPPRPMLPFPPHRMSLESSEIIGNTNSLDDKESDGYPNLLDAPNDTIMGNGLTIPNKSNLTQLQINIKKPHKDNPRNRRPLQHNGPGPGQPVPNMHPGFHLSQGGPRVMSSQQHVDISQPKNVSLQAPMDGSVLLPTQPPPVSFQDNAFRGPRNGIQHRNRGNTFNIGNHGNMSMNYTHSSAAPRPNVIPTRPMGIPPVQSPYFTGPSPSNPLLPSQVLMKRGQPTPMSAPPATVMAPKRIRYDAPSNGYPASPYQHPPPQQQTSYSVSYELPPPGSNPIPIGSDMYGSAPPANVNMTQIQTYNNVDYEDYQMVSQTSQKYGGNGNVPYSTSYDIDQSYSEPYSTSSSSYDTTFDYSSIQTQSAPVAETYAPTDDSYGSSYSSAPYPTTQSGYEVYSSNYVHNTTYSQPVPDQSSAQSINSYPPYSF